MIRWFAQNRLAAIFRMRAIGGLEGALVARDRNKAPVIPPADSASVHRLP